MTPRRRQASDADRAARSRAQRVAVPERGDARPSAAEIERAVLETYRALGMRDCGCIDLIWDGAQANHLGSRGEPVLLR